MQVYLAMTTVPFSILGVFDEHDKVCIENALTCPSEFKGKAIIFQPFYLNSRKSKEIELQNANLRRFQIAIHYNSVVAKQINKEAVEIASIESLEFWDESWEYNDRGYPLALVSFKVQLDCLPEDANALAEKVHQLFREFPFEESFELLMNAITFVYCNYLVEKGGK